MLALETGSGSAFWFGIIAIVAMIVIGSSVIFWARRMARGPISNSPSAFTLEELRAMFERGEITQREFDTARDSLIQKTRRAAQRERERRGGTDWSGPDAKGRSAR